MRRMSLIVFLMALTMMIFLAGVGVGVQYAAHIDKQAPVFASLER